MTDTQKLIAINTLHTAIWLFFNLILVYMFCAVWTKHINGKFWIYVGLIVGEYLILFLLKWTCPMTFWARWYSEDTRINVDIYLPCVFCFFILIP